MLVVIARVPKKPIGFERAESLEVMSESLLCHIDIER